MRRKGSLIRIEAIREVRASVATFGGGVVERLDARRLVPEEGDGFTYQTVFNDLDRELTTVQEKLVSVEDAHTRARIHRSELTRTSEELTTGLYDRQVATRRTLGGVFGPEHGFEVAAFEGSTPRTLDGLVDQVDQTVKLLREPEVDLPTVVIDGVEVTLGSMATGLQGHLDNLEGVRVDLDEARKAVTETVIARAKAIEEYDRVFPWVARVLESYFRLVGELRLAERIRTSVRRVTSREAVEAEQGESEESSSDGSQVAEEASASDSAESASSDSDS